MIENIIKIVNRQTGKEFTDLDKHLVSYAKSDPGTFELIFGSDTVDETPEVFEIEDLKKMSMKSLKEIYDLMAEKLGDDMPKARKNSPTEIITAIVTAQDLSATMDSKEE